MHASSENTASDTVPRRSGGTSLRANATAISVAASEKHSVTMRPESSPCIGSTEYRNGSTGPCVKKKSRYGSFPSLTSLEAYRYHPSSWFTAPHHTANAATPAATSSENAGAPYARTSPSILFIAKPA